MAIQRQNILGIGVSTINMDQAVTAIEEQIARRCPGYVCITGVHGVMESQRDERLRRIHNEAALVTPDGMPLVWLLKLCGWRHVARVYGPDLMLALCQQSAARGYRHYLYGGTDEVLGHLTANLCRRFPGLQIVGAHAPPFRPLTEAEDEAIVHAINRAAPDVVWVGLGTPKQEAWMAAHLGRLEAPVLVGVGAAFDFHAGTKRQAPTWMQQSGLEWLFRLASEPRRLWRRYLINNPLFVCLVISQFLGLRRYPVEGGGATRRARYLSGASPRQGLAARSARLIALARSRPARPDRR